MDARPKDIVGKWFSNVAGIPEDYYFVLESNLAFKKEQKHFNTKHVKVGMKKRTKVSTSGWSNFHMWLEPIKDEITLTKIRRKAIKGILK